MKKLLWRCDDFGSATGANEGIMRVAKLGLPVNVSVLICGPTAQGGIEDLARLGEHVCLGIHAAVNSEWAKAKWGPVTEAARATPLVDAQGHFHPDYEIIGKVEAETIAAEIEGQILRALSWKVPFSYLDEHMGFGWIPGVAPSLAKLADKYGLVFRRELPGLPEIENGSADLVGRLAQQIAAVNDDTPRLVVFHPAIDDDSTKDFYPAGGSPGEVSRERQLEVDALTSAGWQKLFKGGDVQLVSYREI